MYSLPPYFRLILTFSYFSYEFLRELDLGTGRSPDTDKAGSFHGQIRWAKLNDFAPDMQDAMELWALMPHARLAKVISVCKLHVFFHQYVADLRREVGERFEDNFCISLSVGYDCYEFFRGDSFPRRMFLLDQFSL